MAANTNQRCSYFLCTQQSFFPLIWYILSWWLQSKINRQHAIAKAGTWLKQEQGWNCQTQQDLPNPFSKDWIRRASVTTTVLLARNDQKNTGYSSSEGGLHLNAYICKRCCCLDQRTKPQFTSWLGIPDALIINRLTVPVSMAQCSWSQTLEALTDWDGISTFPQYAVNLTCQGCPNAYDNDCLAQRGMCYYSEKKVDFFVLKRREQCGQDGYEEWLPLNSRKQLTVGCSCNRRSTT